MENLTYAIFEQTLTRFSTARNYSDVYLQNAIRRGWETFQYLPAGHGMESLLDVGGRNGLFAPAYLDLFNYADVSVIGDDAPPSGHVDVACRRGGYAMSAKKCDIETEPWPFADESFDMVVCTEVLEHMLFDPLFAANEICRVLKPGGHALITVPNVVSDDSLIWLVNDRQPGYLRYYNVLAVQRGKKDLDAIANMGHFHEYTRSDLEALLRAAGFSMETVCSFSCRAPMMDSFRFRLLLCFVRCLFPRARRLSGSNLLALVRKENYIPLDHRVVRYPAPLYGTIK